MFGLRAFGAWRSGFKCVGFLKDGIGLDTWF